MPPYSSWTRSITEKLIKMLEERECLWDTTSPLYSDREARTFAINEIHAALAEKNFRITPRLIREKIQVLRSQFRKEIRAMRARNRAALGSDSDGCRSEVGFTSRLWCFEKLQFLLPVVNIHEVEGRIEREVSDMLKHGITRKLREPPQEAQVIKKIIPMLDRILIKRAEALTTTKGGIVLPDQAVSKTLYGTVVAVGPGARNTSGVHVPIGVKEGDRVLLPEYGGTKVEMEDKKEYFIFREGDILAKLE